MNFILCIYASTFVSLLYFCVIVCLCVCMCVCVCACVWVNVWFVAVKCLYGNVVSGFKLFTDLFTCQAYVQKVRMTSVTMARRLQRQRTARNQL